MYLLVLLFPFLSFFLTNLCGRYIGIYGCCIFSVFSIASSALVSCFIAYEALIQESFCYVSILPWIDGELLSSTWGFYFDTISITMLFVVCSVSSLVHLYSTEYMNTDPHQGRFMGYLSLFTAFMLILVTADNFVIMFLGWEGIGLASFLLISFWYTRIQAGKSAILAMLVNRVGDLGLAIGICVIFLTFKTVDYNSVFAISLCDLNSNFNFLSMELGRLDVIAFLLFWGAIGKSAQIGLHIWLPLAMEGPTPVSALIHAATLVTAGIFLTIRCSYLFEQSPTLLIIITVVGAITAFFAASVGLVQNDLKRVIAYSTCSQLGYMFFACGLSQYSIALFHLMNHAFFKALLFLGAGSIIHGLSDEQDLRKMGGLVRIFPFSFIMIFIGSIALTGIPFFTGFYSKDAILEAAISRYNNVGNFAFFAGCSAALCTAYYSGRLIILVFLNKPNSYKVYKHHAHEPSLIMLIPLFLLAIGSIFGGFLFKESFLGLGTSFFGTSIFTSANSTIIELEFLSPLFKNMPLIFTLIGFSLSFLFVGFILPETNLYSNLNIASKQKRMMFKVKMSKNARAVYTFLSQKWHFDHVFMELVTHRIMLFGKSICFKLIDKGYIEWLGPQGLAYTAHVFSTQVSWMHSGFLFQYLLIILGFFVLFFNFASLVFFNVSVFKIVVLLLCVSYLLFTIFDNSNFKIS